MAEPVHGSPVAKVSSARAWWAVTAFCVAAILSYTDRQILSLLVDPMRADLGISDTQFSLLQGLAFALIYAFAGLPFGRLADIVSRRWVIIGGVLTWSVATALCGLAGSFGEVFAARMFVGIGEAALAPAAVSIIADSFPASRRGTATGVFLMGMVVGAGAALAIGGGLLEMVQGGFLRDWPIVGDLAPWRAVLVLLGLAGLAVCTILLSITEPARETLAGALPGTIPLAEVVRRFAELRGPLVPLYLAMAFVTLGDFSLLSWGPAHLSRNYGLSASEIGFAMGGISIATGVLGAVSGGYVSDRLARWGGVAARLRAAALAAALGLFGGAVALAATSNGVLVLFGLWLLMSSFSQVIEIIAVQEIVPTEIRGLAMALVSFCDMILGLAGGAYLTALFTEHVYGDVSATGLAITTITVPAGIIAALLYYLSYLKARR